MMDTEGAVYEALHGERKLITDIRPRTAVCYNGHKEYTSFFYNHGVHGKDAVERSKKKMKKHYLRFGLIYCILALLVFATAISFYSKKKIDEVNEFAGYSVINASSFFPESIKDPEEIMLKSLQSWRFTGYSNEEEGFYSSVIDTRDNFNVLLETRDFCCVKYYGEIEIDVTESPDSYETKYTQLAPGDERYLLLEAPAKLTKDEETDLRFSNEVTITGAMCDDNFIYGGNINYPFDGQMKSLKIARPAIVDTENSVPYEDWIVRLDEIVYFPLGENSEGGRLNKSTHKMSDAFVQKFINGEQSSDLQINKGIFTTTASRVFVYDNGNYLVTFYSLMHPFKTVIKQNLNFYIPVLLALILVEAIIVFVIRKLYLNQKNYELRCRKLTQAIAHDLKAPLAETKAHMETWEKLDEDERKEYSEKIISEVDHMSDMVTKLLELSKSNGRNIKLNKEDVDLLLLTQNIKKRNQDELNKKNIDLSILHDEDTDSYPVLADLELMQIAINSFMANSVKHCEKNIIVKLNRTGKTITFAITNDGARIPQSDTDKVWNIDYNSGKEEAYNSESSIGLPVIKNILEAHHAKYSCYNSPKGTTFSFTMDAYAIDPSQCGEDLI